MPRLLKGSTVPGITHLVFHDFLWILEAPLGPVDIEGAEHVSTELHTATKCNHCCTSGCLGFPQARPQARASKTYVFVRMNGKCLLDQLNKSLEYIPTYM